MTRDKGKKPKSKISKAVKRYAPKILDVLLSITICLIPFELMITVGYGQKKITYQMVLIKHTAM